MIKKAVSRGYCFKARELMKDFPTKRLIISGREAKEKSNMYRVLLAAKVLSYSALLVFKDMVMNGTTFYPYHNVESLSFFYIRPSKYDENHWIFFKIKCKQYFWHIRVMFLTSLKKLITLGLLKGCNYGETGKVRYPSHYIEDVKKLFPYLCEKDIRKMLHFGWKQVYKFSINGKPICILYSRTLFVYIDKVPKTSLDHYKHYAEKMSTRIRYEYKRADILYSGYYYFSLSKSRFNRLVNSSNIKVGKKILKTSFGTVLLCRVLDDCRYANPTHLYIFKMRCILPLPIYYFISNLITSNALLIEIRKPMKFRDLCITNNKYKLE